MENWWSWQNWKNWKHLLLTLMFHCTVLLKQYDPMSGAREVCQVLVIPRPSQHQHTNLAHIVFAYLMINLHSQYSEALHGFRKQKNSKLFSSPLGMYFFLIKVPCR